MLEFNAINPKKSGGKEKSNKRHLSDIHFYYKTLADWKSTLT